MPAEAARLLDTDRPWSAARLFRTFEGELTPANRLLAARAEAATDNWARVQSLLNGVPSLDILEDGLGLFLLARAQDEAGNAAAARETYDAFLALPDPARLGVERDAARLRRALLANSTDGSQSATDEIGVAAEWLALLQVEALARAGDMQAVEERGARITSGARARRAWDARIGAAQRAGDQEAARALARQARRQVSRDADRAHFAAEAGRLALEMGDPGAGRSALRAAIAADPTSAGARSAAELLRQGTLSPADHLALARTDRALGLNTEAADHFRAWLDADAGTAAERAAVRYDYADALYYSERYDEVEDALAPIADRAQSRELWAGTLGRLGRADEAAEVFLDLAEEQPGKRSQHVFFAADALHQQGESARAEELYTQVIRQDAGSRWAGLATMRLAGQAFLDKDYAEAARLWDGYRSSSSRGRHSLRSLYWSGRALTEAGDVEAGAERFRQVLRRDRDSYYALLASEALADPFWPIPMSPSPTTVDSAASARVLALLRPVDALRAAGFPDAASAHVDRAVAQAPGGDAVRYALAEALIERGYGQRAIRMGQRLGGGTNARRLRILYPFPFRRMIEAEARERGIDPFIAAALIRQESQFQVRALSHVGARGLMQLMPATAQTLADETGIEDWTPDLLYQPEVNVFLGTRYVAEQNRAYSGDLPSIFSAYNAGPHQVDRWKAFPEYGDAALFTERIPFSETRDYVKILTRNRAFYEGLYGEGSSPR